MRINKSGITIKYPMILSFLSLAFLFLTALIPIENSFKEIANKTNGSSTIIKRLIKPPLLKNSDKSVNSVNNLDAE